jgi:hypothetical protein
VEEGVGVRAGLYGESRGWSGENAARERGRRKQ